MPRKKSARRRPWRLYLLATLVLVASAGAGWYWWDMRQWSPDEETYPDQGVMVSARDGLVAFDTVRALGGKFVYVVASEGSGGKDPRFGRNLKAAQRAGLKTGAVHLFDPCFPADGQSANFVTMVPRDADHLPPVIALQGTAQSCAIKVSDAAVESELMTLVNQVEMHTGQRAILKVSRAFEERYRSAGSIGRDLWLSRDRFPPTYGGRPWLLWSANVSRVTQASEEPLEWVVVQP